MKKGFGILAICALTVGLLAGSASAADVATGMVGYWPLDGNADDHSGNGYHGEVIGDPEWVNGREGKAVKLAGPVGGDPQHIFIPDLSLTSDTVTWVAWINGSNNHEWTGIMISRGINATGMDFGQGTKLHYVWSGNSTWNWHGGPVIPLDTWVMVAISLQPDEATAYVYTDSDGMQSATNAVDHPAETIDALKFGWDTAGGDRWFAGLIDEALLYDRALSDGDIFELAVNGPNAVEPASKLTTTWGSLRK